ncbi:uncharacterized protein K452DRAFT_300361 [Aplosporella prunicola CBS 121167]|uniref:Transaldolase n=1 Tax=Aplosporella prunicola CBS 121167 TaxID=1176127 RepID=A0A6A6B7Q5_9PEZI|nr:uncharacterized protein K452DRAFT_300361 [Aplosporella prunicola CBS 121167]KAF2139295.1 hypothetical protein K452DRAFT_300361 [Aplosporella prunicola CBS 121167]
MGVDTQRPPLPAPTEPSILSVDDDISSFQPDDLATDLSRRTDRSHYSIPEDGSPVTIPTKHKDRGLVHGRHQSQTSLLIEYFEAGKPGEGKIHSRPSVRVRVTPSKHRRSRTASDHVEISQTGKDRKPSYTRRISLPTSKGSEGKSVETSEVSYSGESNLSGRPPVEVEVMHGSDLSRSEVSRDNYIAAPSDISSMPPDSLLGAPPVILSPPSRHRSRSMERNEKADGNRRRSRSLSRERLVTQKVMERLASERSGKSKHSRERSVSKEHRSESGTSRRKHSRSRSELDRFSGTESSLLSSHISRRSGDDRSIRSGVSNASSINNPKLLGAVEDAIKRLILPEINALRETSKTDHNRDRYEQLTRDSVASTSSRGESKRSVSKSSSAPNVKVVLNRDDKNPGVVLSSGSGKEKTIGSNVDSGSELSRDRIISIYGEENLGLDDPDGQQKRTRQRSKLRDGALEAAVGAGLTAAALNHQESRSSLDTTKERRKKRRSKSRSRTASVSESAREASHEQSIPPLPMQSEHNPTEMTRASILSAETDRPHSRSSRGLNTPIQEVIRGSPREVDSPLSRTPNRTPAALRRGPNSNGSLGSFSVPGSAKGDKSIPTRAKDAALTAAGLGGAALASQHNKDEERESIRTPSRDLENESGYKEKFSNASPRPRAKSAASVSSAGREAARKMSELSLHSASNSPSTNAARSRNKPEGYHFEDGVPRDSELSYATITSRGEDPDDFFDHEHEANDAYRAQNDKRMTGYTDDSLRSSNLDYRRMTAYTDDSMYGQYRDRDVPDQDLDGVTTARPDYIHTPLAVESAVASLLDPSSVSSVRSSQRESQLTNDPHFMSRENPGNEQQPQGESLGDKWGAIRQQAKRMSQEQHGEVSSPRSQARSFKSDDQIQMTANAMPFGDPMPEIGHGFDDESELTTNPSEIQGPSRDRGDGHWSYDPTPPPVSAGNARPGEAGMMGNAAAGFAAAAAARLHHETQQSPVQQDRSYQPSIEDDYGQDYGRPYEHADDSFVRQHPDTSSQWKDEGYISSAQPGYTPEPNLDNSKMFDGSLPDFAGTPGADDMLFGGNPGVTRNFSGDSHGMSSPLYDSATGKGIDRIQSKDVVALMDHLTVRDAQRNARDTEILVTLVRSAAEMRNSFEEMKKFISEQDKMIMGNTDKDAEMTVQKLLQGPRPQPRYPRRDMSDADDDLPAKRKNVFRRALKGLSGKSGNDLARIEDMLMHLLDEVEGLKGPQAFPRPSVGQDAGSITSFENLRSGPDAGYEPEGQAGTSSTPNQSGTFSNPSSRRLAHHSGYDGRRGSEHRISTVLEGDEELDDHEAHILDNQFENNERLLTPTDEVVRSPNQRSPPEQAYSQEHTPKSKSKHKSNGSSIFANIPKMSRWSKTTTSTDKTARNGKRGPYSENSQSGSNVNFNGYDDFDMRDDDRYRSNTSFDHRRGGSLDQTRSPSPLIPEHEMDDPKYQAHRNSLNLEHPQPRQGPTHRHQSHLESQAINFDDTQSPDFDQWGSAPSLALNRNRFSNTTGRQSPFSDGGYSNHSASEQVNGGSRPKEEGPLMPSSNNTPRSLPYGSRPMYSSPPGLTGHLAPLAPIEEVRYSLETDRRTLTPSPQPQRSMASPTRKPTGPRPMGSKSPRPLEHSDTVKRRPHTRSPSLDSYRSSLDSFDRDTF